MQKHNSTKANDDFPLDTI